MAESEASAEEFINIVVGDRYKLLRRIGQGSFGDVFEGVDVISGNRVAVKLEETSKRQPLLFYEAQISRALQSSQQLYVPKLYHLGQEGDYNVLVQQLLGPSLGELIKLSSARSFSMWTTLTLGIEIFKLLKFVHDRKYLHRDIKPDNFCMGQDEFSQNVYLIDYGLSKRFIKESTGLHIPIEYSSAFVGSIRYCSLNVNRGLTPSRRDDCESVLYMLAEFGAGDLPWSYRLNGPNVMKQVTDIKSAVSPQQLAHNMPSEFALLFQYVLSLQFEDRPDYSSMVDMFESAKSKLKLNQSQFDWVVLATNQEQFSQLQRQKAQVYKQITHLKGQLTAEENKRYETKQKKPILGRDGGTPLYLDDIDREPRQAAGVARVKQDRSVVFLDTQAGFNRDQEKKGAGAKVAGAATLALAAGQQTFLYDDPNRISYSELKQPSMDSNDYDGIPSRDGETEEGEDEQEESKAQNRALKGLASKADSEGYDEEEEGDEQGDSDSQFSDNPPKLQISSPGGSLKTPTLGMQPSPIGSIKPAMSEVLPSPQGSIVNPKGVRESQQIYEEDEQYYDEEQEEGEEDHVFQGASKRKSPPIKSKQR